MLRRRLNDAVEVKAVARIWGSEKNLENWSNSPPGFSPEEPIYNWEKYERKREIGRVSNFSPLAVSLVFV